MLLARTETDQMGRLVRANEQSRWTDPETGYIRVLIDYLPFWLRGLMVAAFMAAYMSTIGTQLQYITLKNSYGYYLPSFNAAFNATDDVILRLAASRSLTRPDPSAMVPNTVTTSSGVFRMRQACSPQVQVASAEGAPPTISRRAA